jgi:hypothetical protein
MNNQSRFRTMSFSNLLLNNVSKKEPIFADEGATVRGLLKNENAEDTFLESASLIGLLLYSIWSRVLLSLSKLVVLYIYNFRCFFYYTKTRLQFEYNNRPIRDANSKN